MKWILRNPSDFQVIILVTHYDYEYIFCYLPPYITNNVIFSMIKLALMPCRWQNLPNSVKSGFSKSVSVLISFSFIFSFSSPIFTQFSLFFMLRNMRSSRIFFVFFSRWYTQIRYFSMYIRRRRNKVAHINWRRIIFNLCSHKWTIWSVRLNVIEKVLAKKRFISQMQISGNIYRNPKINCVFK